MFGALDIDLNLKAKKTVSESRRFFISPKKLPICIPVFSLLHAIITTYKRENAAKARRITQSKMLYSEV